MKYLLLVVIMFYCNSLIAQSLEAPIINSEIYDETYDFSDIGYLYTTNNFSFVFGTPLTHKASFGVNWLNDNSEIFKGTSEPIEIQGQTLSNAQAFQLHQDNSFSIYQQSEDLFGYSLFDTAMNFELLLDDFDVIPDNHGIVKLKDGRVAYLEGVYDSVNFYNPPNLPDSATYPVLAYDIKIFNPSDSSIITFFDWFERVPKELVVSNYFYAGNFPLGVIDWGHPNWIAEDFDGHILVSWRHLGVFKVDVVTSDVIWWAGIWTGFAEDNGFNELTCISGDCITRLQHSFKPIPNKPGHYSIFDNGDNVRNSSRALFLEVDEVANTIKVTDEFVFDYSPFMGSVDFLPNGDFLVNVPILNSPPRDSITSWNNQGVFADSIGPYLRSSGSNMYLLEANGDIVAKYWTDSLNYIYASQIIDVSDWPELLCDGESVGISQVVEDPQWSNGASTSTVLADGDSLSIEFDFGVTVGYSRTFDSQECLSTALNEDTYSPIIYPNPTTDRISIENYKGDIRIVNVNGQTINNFSSTNGVIDVSDLDAGMYFLIGDSFRTSFVKH